MTLVDVANIKARTVAYGRPHFDAVYNGLQSAVPYVVAVTYASERKNKRVQSLAAGAVPLHGPRTLPDGSAERLIFKVPPAAIQNGTLTLHFTLNRGPNAVASVIELWAPLPAPQVARFSAIPLVSGKLLGSVVDRAYEGVPGITGARC